MTEQSTPNIFANVIVSAGNSIRGLLKTNAPDNFTVSAPVTLPSNPSSPERQSNSSTSSPFSQVANSINHRFVGALPSNHSAPNSINPSHMRTIESLISELTALRDQLSLPSQTTQAPIPIHAPPVGENLL